jgi:hypothetical protein
MNYRNFCFAMILHSIVQNVDAQVSQNQQNQQNADQKVAKFRLDSLDFRISESSQLFVSADYLNEVVYSGRDYGIKQFGVFSGITYRHKSGLWVSAVGNYFSGIPQKWGKADAVIGYATRLDNYLSASFSYAKWFYFGRSQSDLRFTFDHFLSSFWTIDLGWLGLSPQAYYMISKAENVTQIGLTASKYFEFKRVINGKDKIMINPSMTAMLSTKDKAPNGSDFSKGKILRIISYDLNIPITYRRVGKFDITPSLNFTIPVNLEPQDGTHKKPFFYFSVNGKYLLWRT